MNEFDLGLRVSLGLDESSGDFRIPSRVADCASGACPVATYDCTGPISTHCTQES